ncbi:MAG: hypothetical protein Q7K57_47790 [Burkholderiaceae bacterium]|nr:hypothetical protein [Burkholderiaceae bacterium]
MHTFSPGTREEALTKRDKAHYAIHFANRRLVQRSWTEECYIENRKALDSLMLHLAKAKWLLGKVLGTHTAFVDKAGSPAELEDAIDIFDYVIVRAKIIETALINGQLPVPSTRPDIIPQQNGTEILFADGVPLTPTSSPVVVLQGSNLDMGRQYAAQIIQIYGSFILASHARRRFSEFETLEIQKWEAQLAKHMPEILDFAKGISFGAMSAGLKMDYLHALAIFTGTLPPATEARPFALAQSLSQDDSMVAAYLGFDEKTSTKEVPSPCSGTCAWGEATTDGSLVGASSTDHDCTFQATIVAFPDRGNHFVFTPYSANGSIPILGHFYMGGHPGINSKGLAYVHHNGSTMGEPKSEWGYGVRRGPTVMHILQFCDTAKEALEFMLQLPVGDCGISQGTAGGMFADRTYGFSLEARPGSPSAPRPINRELTYDREGKGYQFLYGTNNALAPEAGHLNAAPNFGKGFDYTLEGGWFTFDPTVINSGTPGESIKRRITKNSEGRNRFFHKVLMGIYGDIKLSDVTALYRTSGSIPDGDFEEISKRYHQGEQWDCAPGHRANAFVVSFRSCGEGYPLYRACIGPLNRAVNSRDPGHGYYYYDETSAFWELSLAESPIAVVEYASHVARKRFNSAYTALESLSVDSNAREQLKNWLQSASTHLEQAQNAQGRVTQLHGDERMAAISGTLREYHWAQVRAGQVINAIYPPSTLPNKNDGRPSKTIPVPSTKTVS